MTILLFIVILGVLVFVHELGHFIIAKRAGIRVDEFALGFPPRIFSKKIGETLYAVNIVPFGGYVKIYGEDMLEIPEGEDPDGKRSFVSKNRAVQALVLAGGVLANIVFAWVLVSALFMAGATVSKEQYKDMQLKNERITVVDIFKDSPASEAGLKSGDILKGLRDESGVISGVSIEEVQKFISAHENKKLALDFSRGGSEATVAVIPKLGVISDTAGIGVSLDVVGELELPFFTAFWEGAKRTYDLAVLTAQGLGKFIYDAVMLRADFSSIAGPVGIASLVGDASDLGWFYVVFFTAIISLNLAIINLVPFPALDGGRLLFVIIEAITRKRLPIKFVRWANGIGFVVLITLLVAVTYRDIVRLF